MPTPVEILYNIKVQGERDVQNVQRAIKELGDSGRFSATLLSLLEVAAIRTHI